MSAAVLELEGFQSHPHTFIVKELAFYDVKLGYQARWSFLPPHPWERLSIKKRKTYTWLVQNCHGLPWDSGVLPYTALRTILEALFASYETLYIKGLEKVKFLKKFTSRNIFDLNDFRCPKVKDLEMNVTISCPDHAIRVQHCALVKAVAYGLFLKGALL